MKRSSSDKRSTVRGTAEGTFQISGRPNIPQKCSILSLPLFSFIIPSSVSLPALSKVNQGEAFHAQSDGAQTIDAVDAAGHSFHPPCSPRLERGARIYDQNYIVSRALCPPPFVFLSLPRRARVPFGNPPLRMHDVVWQGRRRGGKKRQRGGGGKRGRDGGREGQSVSYR